MSRSRKKQPFVKDPSNSKMKKVASKVNRRTTKHKIQKAKIEGTEEDLLTLDNKETTNTYDVCDYKIMDEKNDKNKRK